MENMSQDFGHTKRRIQEAKRKKREEKRLKKLNKDAHPSSSPDISPAPGFGEAPAG